MKRIIFMWASLFVMVSGIASAQEITMQSLLRDMVDRDKLTVAQNYRTLQASSYNRASVSPSEPGWFADSDGVFCIREEKTRDGRTEWVLMEDKGPGAIVKIWAVCFYYSMSDRTGANIRIYLDGSEEPAICCNFFDFVKGLDFVKPPFASETTRAGNSYLPIPYSKGCKITMDKKVFYNIINYRHYPAGTPVRTFTMEEYAASSALIDSVGKILSEGCLPQSTFTKHKSRKLAPGQSMSLDINTPRPGAVRVVSLKIDANDHAQALRSTVMKVSFDSEETVWSPVGDFFNIGAGTKPYRMWERSVEEDGTMVCRWVMPYRKGTSWYLENLGCDTVAVELSLMIGPYNWEEGSMYFHSCWCMDDPTPGFPLFDYNLVRVHGTGLYVGDQMTVLNPAEGWWGEGDEKVYVDNDIFPSHFGTGTEDYYGWAGGVVPNPPDEFARPFLANIRVASPNSMGYNTCTRTRVLDAIPFMDSLDFNIEASGSKRNSWFHMVYSSNTYWYGVPGSTTNRVPLPGMAARKLMSVKELQTYNEDHRKNIYVFPGAVEAEALGTYSHGDGVSDGSSVSVWGDLSGGAARCFSFDSEGCYLDVRLTELFVRTPLKICLVTGKSSGKFDISVNGKYVRDVDLLSEHSAVATIDLGEWDPSDNALTIRFACKNPGNLALDYFLVR